MFLWLSSPTPSSDEETLQYAISPHTLIYIHQPTTKDPAHYSTKHDLFFIYTKSQQAAKMPKVVRLTLFKIPDEGMVKEAIQMYNTLASDAKKVRPNIPDSQPSRL
jgi:hypothetical protein